MLRSDPCPWLHTGELPRDQRRRCRCVRAHAPPFLWPSPVPPRWCRSPRCQTTCPNSRRQPRRLHNQDGTAGRLGTGSKHGNCMPWHAYSPAIAARALPRLDHISNGGGRTGQTRGLVSEAGECAGGRGAERACDQLSLDMGGRVAYVVVAEALCHRLVGVTRTRQAAWTSRNWKLRASVHTSRIGQGGNAARSDNFEHSRSVVEQGVRVGPRASEG